MAMIESNLLRIVDAGIANQQLDPWQLARLGAMRLAMDICAAVIVSWRESAERILETRITLHFGEMMLIGSQIISVSLLLNCAPANLKNELPVIHETASDAPDTSQLRYTMSYTFAVASSVVSALAQIGFVLQFLKSGGHGQLFSLCCIIFPLVQTMTLHTGLSSKPRVLHVNHAPYLRTRALERISKPDFKMDVISGNSKQYVLKAFRKARTLLGDTSLNEAETLERHGLIKMICLRITDGLPTLYCIALGILYTSGVSLTTIAVLQQCSRRIRANFSYFFSHLAILVRYVGDVRRVYDYQKNESHVFRDGGVDYLELTRAEGYRGMGLELRDVSFTYPGASRPSISNISATIKPGQLVVIVGTNGSGKSTIIKLITRLYDVSAGQVLLDGRDIREYNLDQLRESMAALTQEHKIFPLSVGENIAIGMGNPDADEIDDHCSTRVLDAARKGGALQLVNKQKEGLEMMLNDREVKDVRAVFVAGNPTVPALQEEFERLNKAAVDVSGGEKQRLVAARTFMRLQSPKIRLAVVDEPTSALDPDGERAIIANLRKPEVRHGRTMIFVTHRFGHLTVHADVIMCLKDGSIVETGTHKELMARGGEYSRLYDIQAGAFST